MQWHRFGKRRVHLVGLWTEAWSSHVALRAWGTLQPTDSTCTFLLLMFTACWSQKITGIFSFFCSVKSVFFIFLFCFFVFSSSDGTVNIFEFGAWRPTTVSVCLGDTSSYKTLSLALLESAHHVTPLFFLILSIIMPIAQAGSHCGTIQNFKQFCYV